MDALKALFFTILILVIVAITINSDIDGDDKEADDEPQSFAVVSGSSNTNELPQSAAISPFAEHIDLKRARAKDDEPKEEYLEIEADDDNLGTITISGWTIESLKSGRKYTIGNVAVIPKYFDNFTEKDAVVLAPGATAYIITSGSPVSVSFRTSICTGYLAENRTFEPRLERSCPNPEDEELELFGIDSTPRENTNDYECVQALERISRCTDPGPADDELSNDCREYIHEIGYELCVDLHKDDSDFFGDEWYIYLDESFYDLWGDESDSLVLRDESGRIVDAVVY